MHLHSEYRRDDPTFALFRIPARREIIGPLSILSPEHRDLYSLLFRVVFKYTRFDLEAELQSPDQELISLTITLKIHPGMSIGLLRIFLYQSTNRVKKQTHVAPCPFFYPILPLLFHHSPSNSLY